LQESWHLPPLSLNLAGQTLWSLARETTPPCLLFLSLSLFLPILPLYSPSSRWTTNRSHKLNNVLLRSQMPSGVVSGHQPTFMDSTTTEGVPVAESLPEEANAIEDSRKNDIGGKHAQLWQQLMRALSRILIPGTTTSPTSCCWCIEQLQLRHENTRQSTSVWQKKYCAQWQLKGSRCLTHDICEIFVGFTQRTNCAITIINLKQA